MRIQMTLRLVCLSASLIAGGALRAAEFVLLEGAAITSLIVEIKPQFEKTTGHTIVRKPDVAPGLKRQIDAGNMFDIAILNPDHIADLVKSGKIVANTSIDIARTGLGVGVRTGSPMPNISTVDSFRLALLNAKSVAHSNEGASGVYFRQILTRLGIAEQMQAKLKPVAIRSAEAVGRGEAEMVVSNVPSIIDAKDVAYVGLVPDEVQVWITLTAGVSSASRNIEPARELIKFLTSDAVVATMKRKGLAPPLK